MLNLKEALAQDIRSGIIAAIKAGKLPALKKLPTIVVDRPEHSEHGDYASPIGLALTKLVRKPPLDIIAQLVEHMPKKEYLGKLAAVAPGFLNMRLNPGWMVARLDDLLEEDLSSDFDIGQGQLVNLEFISANPTGPLTLANCRTAFTADTLGNVLQCVGYNVTREYYSNDAGEQVRRLGQSVLRRMLQAQGESVDFPEDLYQGDYIKEIAAKVAERWRENEGKEFTKEDLENGDLIEKISVAAVELFLSGIKKTSAEDLHIHFDVWTSERALRASGMIEKTLEILREKKQTYRKDGAEYLRTTAFGDDQDRVLVKKDGEYAYIMPDIAYHQEKFKRDFDLIFTFVGADHQGHIPKLKAAIQALGNDVSKFHFVVAQWFRLVRGGAAIKLSKRAGTIYTPKELIDEVGYDAARFFLVRHSLDTPMDFDLDLATEQSERNPVYYALYAYVRLQSILRRAKEEGIIAQVGELVTLSSHSTLTHALELDLMRQLYRWPEVVAECAHSFTVHQLAYYAQDLARAIHVFYRQVPVISAEGNDLIRSRLQLVAAARTVMGKTLELLGLSQPDVM